MLRILQVVLIVNFIVFPSYSIDCDVDDKNDESRIKKALFCNAAAGYDNTVRPVSNHKTTTNVQVKMNIKSYDFDDHFSTLTVNSWMVTKWRDEFLVWDPLRFGNIKSIDVRSSLIWRPDLALYNADISYGIGSCHETTCLIENNGNISCIEPCSYTAHCTTNYDLWPYDRQNCSFIFGPWSNFENGIDYNNGAKVVPMSGSAQNMQWRMLSTNVWKRTLQVRSSYDESNSTIPNLVFSFVIERHSSLIAKAIHSPCLILIMMNVFILFIDTNMIERVSMIAFNILMHFQIIHQISWILPHGGESLPRTLTFFRNSVILTLVSLFVTLFLKQVSNCERPVPEWFKQILNVTFKRFGFNFLEEAKNDDDGNSLIDAKEWTRKENAKAWQNLSSFINNFTLIAMIIIYLIMTLTLIPFYSSKNA